MRPLPFLAWFFFSESDALADTRDRAMIPILAMVAAVMFLFMLNNVVHGRHTLAAALALLVAVLVIDVVALRRGRPAPLPYLFLLLPFGAGMAISMIVQGAYGAFWSYPILTFCHFALARRTAFFSSIVLIASTSGLASMLFGPEFALRSFVSLMLTWLMINVVLNVLVELHGKLLRQAITDPLTGALNRRQMDIALGELLRRARGRPVPASILLVDIDNFKQINDQFGHAAGDEVLVGLVQLITARKRTVDSLYRMGGEEFLLLLQETSALAASVVAEQLRALIEDAALIKDLPITISIGVAECEAGYAPEQWLKAADEALYRAKKKGRNRVENSTFGESRPEAPA